MDLLDNVRVLFEVQQQHILPYLRENITVFH